MIAEPRIAEQAMRAFEPLLHHILGKGRATFVEQPLNVARRNVLARRNGVHRKACGGQVPRDVALDHLHSRRPDPASVGKRRGVGRRAERLGEQVVDMGHGRMLQAGVSERRRFFVQQREIPL